MSYQGRDAYEPRTTTADEDAISALISQIANLEDRIQDAEDREQMGRVSALRRQLAPLKVALKAKTG